MTSHDHNHDHTKEVLTMAYYAPRFQWMRMLGWSEDELASVPVYEEFPAGEETINLADFGGTSLGVIQGEGSPSSADARAIRNMWVCKGATPPELWQRLQDLAAKGGPSGYTASTSSTEASFPPSGL